MYLYPKISIVTPTFNQGEYIEQTIQSVLNEGYPNLEYIIIDGGSTDNTVEIIKKYEKYFKFWISEKDKGQSNAINKGLRYCTGEIFNWLNSDDYLEPGALKVIAKSFSAGADLVAGKVRLFEGKGKNEKVIEYVQHSKLSAKGIMYWLKGVQFVQPGVWMRRSLFYKCGGIDENLHYCFDWDLYIRYLSLFPDVTYTDNLLIHFRYHNQSKTVSMQERFQQEELKIVEKLSVQRADNRLRKIAVNRILEREWFYVLKESMNQTSNNKAERIFTIAKQINLSNIRLWRATAGAVRRIVFNQQ